MQTTGSLRPIYICGSTATGKTAVSIALANAIGGEIVNADAYQVYQDLDTITAAPSAEELALAPHHLFGILKPSEDFDAQRFLDIAKPTIAEIQSRGKIPIIVGGSGMYLKFLTHGVSPVPAGDETLRAYLETLTDEAQIEKLVALDPIGAADTNLKNRRYVIRALEICILSGEPMSKLKTDWKQSSIETQKHLRGFLLDWDRDLLRERIGIRTERMIKQGAIHEVKEAYQNNSFSKTSIKAIGVRDIIHHLDGEITQERCQELIFFATCQYAKRQRTWFQKEQWIKPITMNPDTQTDSIIDSIILDL